MYVPLGDLGGCRGPRRSTRRPQENVQSASYQPHGESGMAMQVQELVVEENEKFDVIKL